jgi:hypothetical protein
MLRRRENQHYGTLFKENLVNVDRENREVIFYKFMWHRKGVKSNWNGPECRSLGRYSSLGDSGHGVLVYGPECLFLMDCIVRPLFMKFRDCVCRERKILEHLYPELPNIYLSRDISHWTLWKEVVYEVLAKTVMYFILVWTLACIVLKNLS